MSALSNVSIEPLDSSVNAVVTRGSLHNIDVWQSPSFSDFTPHLQVSQKDDDWKIVRWNHRCKLKALQLVVEFFKHDHFLGPRHQDLETELGKLQVNKLVGDEQGGWTDVAAFKAGLNSCEKIVNGSDPQGRIKFKEVFEFALSLAPLSELHYLTRKDIRFGCWLISNSQQFLKDGFDQMDVGRILDSYYSDKSTGQESDALPYKEKAIIQKLTKSLDGKIQRLRGHLRNSIPFPDADVVDMSLMKHKLAGLLALRLETKSREKHYSEEQRTIEQFPEYLEDQIYMNVLGSHRDNAGNLNISLAKLDSLRCTINRFYKESYILECAAVLYRGLQADKLQADYLPSSFSYDGEFSRRWIEHSVGRKVLLVAIFHPGIRVLPTANPLMDDSTHKAPLTPGQNQRQKEVIVEACKYVVVKEEKKGGLDIITVQATPLGKDFVMEFVSSSVARSQSQAVAGSASNEAP